MDYGLLVLIIVAICLHLIEYCLKRYRKWLVIINVSFHLISFLLFAVLGKDLTDVFVFFLSSTVFMLLLALKEVKNGI